MPTVDRTRPSVSVIYAHIIIKMAVEDYGVDRAELVDGLNIPDGLLSRFGSRISINQHVELIRRAIRMIGGDGGLGYELGFRLGLSSHGIVGLAALSQLTVRSAVNLVCRFSPVVTPSFRLSLFVEDQAAVLDVHMDLEFEDLHRQAYDMALVTLWRGAMGMVGDDWRELELWFDYPEPEYYPRYRERLPRCRFDMGANQLCGPARLLDRRMAGGEAVTAQLLEAQCRSEMQLMGEDHGATVASRLRSLLSGERDGYPDLDAASKTLFMSSRTLKRKLQLEGSSFQLLLEEVKRDEATRLLTSSPLSIEKIATRLGYSDPSTFTHVFRKWTGQTPSQYRRQQVAEGGSS